MPAANRTVTRETVVQTVFEAEFRDATKHQEYLTRILTENAANAPGELDLKLANDLTQAVFDNFEVIKKEIARLAPDWPYEKIARFDRAVLLTAIAELKFITEKIPPAVTLNEYIEITKNFSDDPSRRFVNGVLSAVKKEIDKP